MDFSTLKITLVVLNVYQLLFPQKCMLQIPETGFMMQIRTYCLQPINTFYYSFIIR